MFRFGQAFSPIPIHSSDDDNNPIVLARKLAQKRRLAEHRRVLKEQRRKRKFAPSLIRKLAWEKLRQPIS